jgi:transcription elongation factor GreA
MERIPMTASGLQRLQDELKRLKNVDRPDVIRAIAEAREHGDLSENAEYHAAKERQGFIESQIGELEGQIGLAQVIDVSTLSGDTVKFGATVRLVDIDTDEEFTYQIVGQVESDIKAGRLSVSSPIARALIGKREGDEIDVATPGGRKQYEVLQVQFV